MQSGREAEVPVSLRVRLFGTVEVILGGARLDAFSSPRLQRFLALVVVRNEPWPRSRLAFELWPDSTERQARTNLRKLLHEVRHSMPGISELIESDDDNVHLAPADGIDVDVWRLREAISVGDFGLAARLYSGDLAPACHDEWILAERELLRSEAHRALTHLVEDAVTAGDHPSTIRLCERLIEIEPADEQAVGRLMEAQSALGNRSAALRSYHRCAKTLERDLAVVPGEPLTAIYRALQTDGAEPADGINDGVAPIAESPFVGRQRELQRLSEAWERSREGGAHLVLVTGEPGIGKSRLAAEFGRRVRADGHAPASARAYEAAGRLPWAPIVDLLRSDEVHTDIDALDPIWKHELATLLPELAESSNRSGAQPPGGLGQRYRLFEAVSQAIVGARPRLVIIDDLQWCDADTVEMIGYLTRNQRAGALLVVGTVRDDHLDDHPLAEVVSALARENAVTVLPVTSLDEATTMLLASRLDATHVEPDLAARLWSETEGNPLFVIEALRAGIRDDADAPAITPTIRSVLLGRLHQLPDRTRRLVEFAAVLGRPFSVELMMAATGSTEDEVVDQIDDLWRRRIVSDHGPSYDFTHDRLRAVAHETVSPARRRQIHRAFAAAMTAIDGADDSTAAQIAAHFDQAGMVDEAVEAYRRAGERAVAVSAFDEAVVVLRRAIALLADLAPDRDRDARELDLRIALGSPLVALEGYGADDAHVLYERANQLCRKLGRPASPPVLRGLGLARLQGCRFDDAARLAKALLESPDAAARTEGWYLLGVSDFWRGDIARAKQRLLRAIEDYDPRHRDEHLASYAQDPKAVCLVRLAWAELWAGDAEGSRENVRRAIDRAADLDHLMTSNYVLTYAAIIAAESEDLDELAAILDDLERLWTRLPMPYLMIVGGALRGWSEVCRGRTDGIERIVESVTRSRVDGESLHLTYCLVLLARARSVTGELRDGRAALREALTWSDRTDQRYLEAEALRVDGELAVRLGHAEDALESWRRAIVVATEQEAHFLVRRALHSLTDHFPTEASRDEMADLLGDQSI